MSPSLKPEQWQSIQHLFEGQRLRRGWTREELARKAGLSRTTLFYFFERSGTQQPRLTTIKRLAETFELDFQQIIDQTFAPSNSTSESSNRLGFQVPSSFPLSTPFSPGFDRQTNPVVQEVLDESRFSFRNSHLLTGTSFTVAWGWEGLSRMKESGTKLANFSQETTRPQA